MLRTLEEAVLAGSDAAGPPVRRSGRLADLDVLIQTSDELARYLDRVSKAIDPLHLVDLSTALDDVRLRKVRIGLGGRSADARGAVAKTPCDDRDGDHGHIDLF